MIATCTYDTNSNLLGFACDATRGRCHQDFPDLEKYFPNQHDWDKYETTGPLQKLDDDQFDLLYTILPWEDHADFVIRTRGFNNSRYVEEITNALRCYAFGTHYDHEDKMKSAR